MNMLISLAAAAAFAAAAAVAGCGALGPPPGAETRTGGPVVLSATPVDGALGVRADAQVTVTFDRPMSGLETQAAFQSPHIRAPTFEWNAAFTVMTVTPAEPLEYAYGSDTTAFPPRRYEFQITQVARDRDGVNLARPYRSSFSTLRRAFLSLASDAELDGYVRADGVTDTCVADALDPVGRPLAVCVGHSMLGNLPYKGLLTFDLSRLPRELAEIERGTLSVYQYRVDGRPYTVLGTVNLEHVTYERKPEAYRSGALRHLGLLSSTAEIGWKESQSADRLIAAVREDHLERVARNDRSQYRLVFSNPDSPDAPAGHVAKFYTRMVEHAASDSLEPQRRYQAPRLEVTFVLP